MKRTVYIGLGIFLFGMIARWVVFHFVRVPWIIYDEYIYLDTARQILHTDFVSHLYRDQSYPPGWPFLLAPIMGVFHDPFVQYRAALILTMVLSSGVAVLAYVFTGSIGMGLLTSLFPPLFLYSGSIMSETAYTLVLFFLLFCIRVFVREDLKTARNILLSGIIVGFLCAYLQEIRSFGRIIFPALLLAFGTLFVLYRKEKMKWVGPYVYFLMSTAITYVFVNFLAKKFLHTTLYETQGYMSSLQLIVSQLGIKIMLNQFAAVMIELYGVVLVVFMWGTYRTIRMKNKAEVFPRLFVWFVFLASFGLTLLHMLKTAQHDKQYWIFTRYLDPVIVLMFVYGLKDGYTFLMQKKNIAGWWIISFIAFVLYVYRYLYTGSYKFGNTMGIFFMADEKVNQLFAYILPLIIFLLALVVALRRKKQMIALSIFILFFLYQAYVATTSAIAVPHYVIDRYEGQIAQWQRYFATKPVHTPLCRYKSNASAEVYYLYSFLSPYHYLHTCESYSEKEKPKYVLVRPGSVKHVFDFCEEEFVFEQDDVVYYCPFGYK